MKLHHQVLGSGPPLVLLHGLLGSSDNWHYVAKAFAGRYTVHSVDQRNHGASPHSDTMDYPLMAADLLEYFETHGFESVLLVGHSMGGKVAMEFALQYPERVEKLVIEDVSPRLYLPTHGPIFEALQALELNKYRERAQLEDALALSISGLGIRRFLLKNIGRNEDGRFFWKIHLQGISGNYNHLLQPVSEAAPFAKPACFICGGQSNYVLHSDVPLIRRLFPQACIFIVPQANHWVHFEKLDAFVDLAGNFLQKNQASEFQQIPAN